MGSSKGDSECVEGRPPPAYRPSARWHSKTHSSALRTPVTEKELPNPPPAPVDTDRRTEA